MKIKTSLFLIISVIVIFVLYNCGDEEKKPEVKTKSSVEIPKDTFDELDKNDDWDKNNSGNNVVKSSKDTDFNANDMYMGDDAAKSGEMIRIKEGYAYIDGKKKKIGRFYIDKYEITNGQFRAFAKAKKLNWPPKKLNWPKDFNNFSYFKDEEYNNYPVVGVTWYEAKAFCKWSKFKEYDKDLPSEAEWQRAVGTTKAYLWGSDELELNKCNNANLDLGNLISLKFKIFNGNGPIPIGQFEANKYGIYDLAGNVWEWCNDYYDDAKTKINIRGGSWDIEDSEVFKVNDRFFSKPNFRSASFGFRCAIR